MLYALCSMLLGLGQSRLVVSHDPWVNGNVAYLSAAGIALARALRQAQLCLRDCRWASGAGLAPRLAGNRRLATVLALAKQLGPLSLFLSVAPPVLPALRGPWPWWQEVSSRHLWVSAWEVSSWRVWSAWFLRVVCRVSGRCAGIKCF